MKIHQLKSWRHTTKGGVRLLAPCNPHKPTPLESVTWLASTRTTTVHRPQTHMGSLAPAVRNEHGAPSPAGSCIGINAESSGAHASLCVRRATRSGLPPQAVMWWEYAVVGIRPPMNRDSLRRVWHGTASARPPTLRPPRYPLKRRARRGVAEGPRARFRRENPEAIPARLPQVGDASFFASLGFPLLMRPFEPRRSARRRRTPGDA